MKMPTAPTPSDPIFVPVKLDSKETEKPALISTNVKIRGHVRSTQNALILLATMHVLKFVQILVNVIDLVMVENNHALIPVYLEIGATKDVTKVKRKYYSPYENAMNNNVVSSHLFEKH